MFPLLLLTIVFCIPMQAMQRPANAFRNTCPSSNTRILDTIRATVPHYGNIDHEIVTLLHRYKIDDQFIAALLPMAELPLIGSRIDIKKLDEKRSLDDAALGREIDLMLQAINSVLGNLFIKNTAKRLLTEYLKKGL